MPPHQTILIRPHQLRLKTRYRSNPMPKPLCQLPIRMRTDIQHPSAGEIFQLPRYGDVSDIKKIAVNFHGLITDGRVFVDDVRDLDYDDRERHEGVLRESLGAIPVGCVQGHQLLQCGGCVSDARCCLSGFHYCGRACFVSLGLRAVEELPISCCHSALGDPSSFLQATVPALFCSVNFDAVKLLLAVMVSRAW